MICNACRLTWHDKCKKGAWCDCQHKPIDASLVRRVSSENTSPATAEDAPAPVVQVLGVEGIASQETHGEM